MPSRNVCIGLHHRDRLSEGNMRRVFGYEAYHWAIVVMPEQSTGQDCWTFEATDATYLDPVTFRMVNPKMEWWFKINSNADLERDLELSSKLIGIVVIGQISDNMLYDEVLGIMKSVPLPVADQNPQQSCVTWAGNAIRTLQGQGWISLFDVGQFKDWALAYADDRMRGGNSTQPKLISYR